MELHRVARKSEASVVALFCKEQFKAVIRQTKAATIKN